MLSSGAVTPGYDNVVLTGRGTGTPDPDSSACVTTPFLVKWLQQVRHHEGRRGSMQRLSNAQQIWHSQRCVDPDAVMIGLDDAMFPATMSMHDRDKHIVSHRFIYAYWAFTVKKLEQTALHASPRHIAADARSSLKGRSAYTAQSCGA
jgi:hypothetical protein